MTTPDSLPISATAGSVQTVPAAASVPVDFTGKVVLIAGASGGLGASVASEMIARGASAALTFRRISGRITGLLEQAPTAAPARAYQLDLTDERACLELVEQVRHDLGELDCLIHAAGPHVPMVHLSKVSPSELRRQVIDDVGAFFNLVTAALPSLRITQGNIVAVTSAATDRYPVRDGLSATPKGAVEALARGLAAEEGRYGVRVNCVGPGMLTDGMAERLIAEGDLDDRALAAARANIPLRRFGVAADIAEAVCFLASSRAGFITGQKINVDGGYTV